MNNFNKHNVSVKPVDQDKKIFTLKSDKDLI